MFGKKKQESRERDVLRESRERCVELHVRERDDLVGSIVTSTNLTIKPKLIKVRFEWLWLANGMSGYD